MYGHDVYEDEVEDVLLNAGEDRPGREGSRVAIGQTNSGRLIKVIYVREQRDFFVITAYDLAGKPLAAYRRRQRKRGRK